MDRAARCSHGYSTMAVLAVVGAMAVTAGLLFWASRTYVIHHAEENIQNLLLSHFGIHHYVQQRLIPSYGRYQQEHRIPGDFYAPELLSSSYIVRNQHEYYNAERRRNGLPELYYKLAANNPRNPVNLADDHERRLIGMFNRDPGLKEHREIIAVDGRSFLYVAIPFLRNEARCLNCHGDRTTAPPDLQRLYPGEGGFNERTGEIRAITSIRAPLENEYLHLYAIGATILVGFLGFGLLFLLNTRLHAQVQARTVSLQSSEERYRLIFEEARDGMAVADADSGTILHCNRALCRLIGRDASELVGQPQRMLHPAQDCTAGVSPTFSRHRASDTDQVLEENLLAKDGRLIPVEISATRTVIDGRSCLLGIFHDITERRVAQRQLEQASHDAQDARQRAERYLEISEALIVQLDQHGRIQIINERGCALLGWTQQELVGRDWFATAIPPEDRPVVTGVFHQVMAGVETVSHFENHVVDRQGRIRFIAWHNIPLRNEDGSCCGLISSGIDITARKLAEEERDRLNGLLRQRETFEAIGQLAGGIAHDFNNQLAVILGYGEILQAQAHDPQQRRKIDIILAAAQRSQDLTRQLLSYARRAALRQERIDLHALIRETAEMLQRSLDRRIDIALNLGATRPAAGDSGQLQNALLNMCLNARDAMPQGGTLRLATTDRHIPAEECRRLGLDPAREDWVEITISDTGVGMPPEILQRIFEPFFTTKGPGKGTGLGLATAQGTILQMGGMLDATSIPGRGSTFRILLPMDAGAEPVTAPVAAAVTRRLRLLVVDDETDVRGAFCEQLESRGHSVTAMADGHTAIAWFKDHAAETDLVLLDLNMPQMNGIDVLRAMRALDATARIAIVTGNAETAMTAGVMALGATAVLEKPVSAKALAELDQYARRRSVLIIDDETALHAILRRHVARFGYDAVGVVSADAALAHLADHSVDLLLVDQLLPGTDGASVLQALRAAGHQVPAIIITGDTATVDPERLRPLGVIGIYEKSDDVATLIALINRSVGATRTEGPPP